MTGSRLRLLFLAAVIGMLMSATYYTLFAPRAMETAPPHAFSSPWIYGETKARFTITEYADLECPYCKEYFPQLKNWVDANPEVNLQWHHLPLPIHEPAAGREARLAECVGIYSGNQAFWEVVDMIYRQTSANGVGLSGTLDLNSATSKGLAQTVKRCAIPSHESGKRVQEQAAQAAAKGINATPTLIVTDNRSQRSIKLLGSASGDTLLSAIDWLSSPDSVNAVIRSTSDAAQDRGIFSHNSVENEYVRE